MFKDFDPTLMEDDVRRMRRGPDIGFVQENLGSGVRRVKDDLVDWKEEAAVRKALELLDAHGFMVHPDVVQMADRLCSYVTGRVIQELEDHYLSAPDDDLKCELLAGKKLPDTPLHSLPYSKLNPGAEALRKIQEEFR